MNCSSQKFSVEILGIGNRLLKPKQEFIELSLKLETKDREVGSIGQAALITANIISQTHSIEKTFGSTNNYQMNLVPF